MDFKLHTTDLSPFGQRAKLALRAKGLLGETELNDTFGGTDALGELAPMRQIPILEHDGLILPESQVIADYLDDIVPEPPLLPEAPAARARARLLARIADLYIAPHFLSLIVGMRPPPRPDDMAIAWQAMGKGLGFAETYLDADSAYAVGDSLSLADIALAPFFFYVPRMADWHNLPPLDETPVKCKAYFTAIENDPHVNKAFTEMERAYKARIDMLKS